MTKMSGEGSLWKAFTRRHALLEIQANCGPRAGECIQVGQGASAACVTIRKVYAWWKFYFEVLAHWLMASAHLSLR